MIIKSKDLKLAFKSKWPKLRQIWLRNKKFIAPSFGELSTVVRIVKKDIPKTKIIAGFNECENLALYLHSVVKLFRAKLDLPERERLNWAFGDFICQKETMFDGLVVHTACICFCDDKFYVIEPMDDYSIQEISKIYRPFFINM